jgi:Uma2 family endonuclease
MSVKDTTRSQGGKNDFRGAVSLATPAILPLENGDRLTRPEFERRYQAMPDIKKAELIEGVVYMPSPIRASHSSAHGAIMTWLGSHQVGTPKVILHDNATVRLDMDNEVQPDALLRVDSALGGSSAISPDDYIEGPPELIVEIAGSSAAYDLHDKLSVYRRNQVQEYLVWQIYDKQLNWFQLSEGVYAPLTPDSSGVIRSQVFPGLYLDVAALLEGDLSRVAAVLQQGLASPEHAAFMEHLSRK